MDKTEEVVKAFRMMFDNYPESAILVNKDRDIIAVNKLAPATGRVEGIKCATVPPPEQHNGCKLGEAAAAGQAAYRKKTGALGDVISFWVPVEGHPDYFVHFSVGSIKKYEYNQ